MRPRKFSCEEARERDRARCKRWAASPAGKAWQKAYNKQPSRQEWIRKHKQLPEIKGRERDLGLRRRYGISQADYDDMLCKQNDCCALCLRRLPSTLKNLHPVDHDHETLAIRGILCHRCNNGLGCFADDPELLLLAVKYLTRERIGLSTSEEER